MPKNGKSFIFPCADGSVKLSGRDEVFRTSTLKKQDLLAREGGSTMMSFKESRTGLIQQINNERMTLKPETISGENLRIMFIAISFNQGSNFMCQTEGHSFHTTHLYRRCQAVECRHRMSCWRVASTTIGTSLVAWSDQGHGMVSSSSHY